MARKRQSSSGFNVAGFDSVEMSVDLGEAIDRWRDVRDDAVRRRPDADDQVSPGDEGRG